MFVMQVIRIYCVLNIFYGRIKISLNFVAALIMDSASSVLEIFRLLYHASVRVLLMSLLPLLVTKLILSLYFSCSFFLAVNETCSQVVFKLFFHHHLKIT